MSDIPVHPTAKPAKPGYDPFGATAGTTWRPNTPYKAGTLTVYQGIIYSAKADFTSTATFNASNWDVPTDPFTGVYGDLLITGEEVMDRDYAGTNTVTTLGTVRFTYFTARKSEAINNIRMWAGTTIAAGLTLARMGVYLEDPTTRALSLLGASVNDTALFAVANTGYTKALNATVNKAKGQRYAVAVLMTGTTAATLLGTAVPTVAADMWAGAPRLAGLLAGQTDLPASVAVGSIANLGARHQAILT